MPTNLKSLLSRSRSRTELKSKAGEDTLSTDSAGCNNDAKDIGGAAENGCFANGDSLPRRQTQVSHCFDQFLHCDTFSGRNVQAGVVENGGMRNGGSCSHLVSSYSDWTSKSGISPETRTGAKNDFLSPKSSGQDGMVSVPELYVPRPCATMRKCETVITLSTYSGNGSQQHFSNGGVGSGSCCGGETQTSISGTSEKAKVMKNKLLSTSSSTLNCLLHSSSRSKLFSGWKLSSGESSHPEFVASNPSPATLKLRGSSNDMTDVFKSQLSIPESGGVGTLPMTPTNRLRRNVSINNTFYAGGGNGGFGTTSSSFSRSSSVASFVWREPDDFSQEILCRLCLCNVKYEETVEIAACSCRYCKDCITAYISFEIQEAAEDIACPDASCEKQGVLSFSELELLVSPSMVEKHKKFRLYREVEKDGQLVWCPSPGCETICRIQDFSLDADAKSHKSRGVSNTKSLTINCTTCSSSFCAECKLSCHSGISCESFRRKLIKQGKLSVDDDELFSLDCIKKCPFCHVPIEKDSGCAQMMCKKCKHVFCWYCLASLDDDFLLRHYDKGPCKNKLGHSRASVVWHRMQVIGIFAGFGVLVLLASPLLILAAPCLLCCRCRYCSKDSPEESPVHV